MKIFAFLSAVLPLSLLLVKSALSAAESGESDLTPKEKLERLRYVLSRNSLLATESVTKRKNLADELKAVLEWEERLQPVYKKLLEKHINEVKVLKEEVDASVKATFPTMKPIYRDANTLEQKIKVALDSNDDDTDNSNTIKELIEEAEVVVKRDKEPLQKLIEEYKGFLKRFGTFESASHSTGFRIQNKDFKNFSNTDDEDIPGEPAPTTPDGGSTETTTPKAPTSTASEGISGSSKMGSVGDKPTPVSKLSDIPTESELTYIFLQTDIVPTFTKKQFVVTCNLLNNRFKTILNQIGTQKTKATTVLEKAKKIRKEGDELVKELANLQDNESDTTNLKHQELVDAIKKIEEFYDAMAKRMDELKTDLEKYVATLTKCLEAVKDLDGAAAVENRESLVSTEVLKKMVSVASTYRAIITRETTDYLIMSSKCNNADISLDLMRTRLQLAKDIKKNAEGVKNLRDDKSQDKGTAQKSESHTPPQGSKSAEGEGQTQPQESSGSGDAKSDGMAQYGLYASMAMAIFVLMEALIM